MKCLSFILCLLYVTTDAYAGHSCEIKFDRLEELRISSFAAAAEAVDLKTCNKITEDFLKQVGPSPHGCTGAKSMIQDWSDPYQSDTHQVLPSDPTAAFTTIKNWAYQTLKDKCSHRKF